MTQTSKQSACQLDLHLFKVLFLKIYFLDRHLNFFRKNMRINIRKYEGQKFIAYIDIDALNLDWPSKRLLKQGILPVTQNA
ncbi:hypothetical protein BBL07_14845 [Agrobacterium vitis]|nr:hypothetical protein BBL07_14845 [Agrobacterium vitis]